MNPPVPTHAARLRALSAALVSAFILSGCVVYYGQPIASAPATALIRLATERGEGAVYRTGEPLRFSLRSERPGFISLWATDPDGSRYELARNVTVRQGRNLISGPTPNTRFRLVPPGGEHRVRAYFSERPFRHTASWNDPDREVAPYAQDSAETRFLVLVR